jgi:hypothetical protein
MQSPPKPSTASGDMTALNTSQLYHIAQLAEADRTARHTSMSYHFYRLKNVAYFVNLRIPDPGNQRGHP